MKTKWMEIELQIINQLYTNALTREYKHYLALQEGKITRQLQHIHHINKTIK